MFYTFLTSGLCTNFLMYIMYIIEDSIEKSRKYKQLYIYQRFNREALHRLNLFELNSGLINESQNNLFLFNKELRKTCSLDAICKTL